MFPDFNSFIITQITLSKCPCKIWTQSLFFISQIFTVLSKLLDAKYLSPILHKFLTESSCDLICDSFSPQNLIIPSSLPEIIVPLFNFNKHLIQVLFSSELYTHLFSSQLKIFIILSAPDEHNKLSFNLIKQKIFQLKIFIILSAPDEHNKLSFNLIKQKIFESCPDNILMHCLL